MSTRVRSTFAAIVTAILIASVAGALPGSAGAAQRSRGSWLDRVCSSTGSLQADRLPASVSRSECDLVGRTVVSGSVALEVPRPGHGVSGAATGEYSESQLFIHTTRKGVVTIEDGNTGSPETSAASLLLAPGPAEPCDESPTTPGCLAPCDTNSHSVNPSNAKVKKGQPWRYKLASTPNTLTDAFALAQIKAGTKNVVNVKNTCLLADVVPKTSAYKGTTTAGTGMSANASSVNCGASGNGKNTVEFGVLPTTVLGFACTRTQRIGTNPWFIVEGDIRLKNNAAWTTTIDDPGCSNQYDLQGVMTHERAHTFGVGHAVNDVAHSQLTMYPSSYPCNSYARTLGKGDHTALKKLY